MKADVARLDRLVQKQIQSIFAKKSRFWRSQHLILPEIKGQKVALMFSGGLDSTLLTWYLKQTDVKVVLFSLVTEERLAETAHILRTSEWLGLELVTVSPTPGEIERAVGVVGEILRKEAIEQNLIQVSLAVGMFLVAREVGQRKMRVLLSGQGPDEIFAGYARFLQIKPEELRAALQRKFRITERVDQVRDKAIAEYWRLQLISPFLSQRLLEFSLSLSYRRLIDGEMSKIIWRELGREKGLPEWIYNRRKRAFQYSSGIQKLVKKVIS